MPGRNASWTSGLMGVIAWATLSVASAPAAPPADSPAERPDPRRWEEAIEKLEATEASHPVQPGGVVFVGSSSIVMWDLKQSFPELPVINRGFGGSNLADSVHYADRLVVKHRPRVVVLYAGDNDIEQGLSAEQVVDDYGRFVRKVRAALPQIQIVYVPIKPSIARWQKYSEMARANRAIRALIEKDERQWYVSIEPAMLDEAGRPRPELFLEDGLHLSEEGYAVWNARLRPLLVKLMR